MLDHLIQQRWTDLLVRVESQTSAGDGELQHKHYKQDHHVLVEVEEL